MNVVNAILYLLFHRRPCEIIINMSGFFEKFTTKKVDVDYDYSVFLFGECVLTKNFFPALQRHYAVVQALALDEDEMPEIKDETVPDEEGMARYWAACKFCSFFVYPLCFQFPCSVSR